MQSVAASSACFAPLAFCPPVPVVWVRIVAVGVCTPQCSCHPHGVCYTHGEWQPVVHIGGDLLGENVLVPTPRRGDPPYLDLGCLHFPVWPGGCWLLGVHQGSIPSVLCVFVWPWLSCVVGVVLAFCFGALCAALRCPCTRVLLW